MKGPKRVSRSQADSDTSTNRDTSDNCNRSLQIAPNPINWPMVRLATMARGHAHEPLCQNSGGFQGLERPQYYYYYCYIGLANLLTGIFISGRDFHSAGNGVRGHRGYMVPIQKRLAMYASIRA